MVWPDRGSNPCTFIIIFIIHQLKKHSFNKNHPHVKMIFLVFGDLRWGVLVWWFEVGSSCLVIWGGECLLLCLCWWNCWPSLFKHHKNQHSNPLQYVYGNLKQYAIYLHLSSRLWVSDCCFTPTQQFFSYFYHVGNMLIFTDKMMKSALN